MSAVSDLAESSPSTYSLSDLMHFLRVPTRGRSLESALITNGKTHYKPTVVSQQQWIWPNFPSRQRFRAISICFCLGTRQKWTSRLSRDSRRKSDMKAGYWQRAIEPRSFQILALSTSNENRYLSVLWMISKSLAFFCCNSNPFI